MWCEFGHFTLKNLNHAASSARSAVTSIYGAAPDCLDIPENSNGHASKIGYKSNDYFANSICGAAPDGRCGMRGTNRLGVRDEPLSLNPKGKTLVLWGLGVGVWDRTGAHALFGQRASHHPRTLLHHSGEDIGVRESVYGL